MKSKEEWCKDYPLNDLNKPSIIDRVEAIQKDAYQQALEDCKEIIKIAYEQFAKTKVTPYNAACVIQRDVLLNTIRTIKKEF